MRLCDKKCFGHAGNQRFPILQKEVHRVSEPHGKCASNEKWNREWPGLYSTQVRNDKSFILYVLPCWLYVAWIFQINTALEFIYCGCFVGLHKCMPGEANSWEMQLRKETEHCSRNGQLRHGQMQPNKRHSRWLGHGLIRGSNVISVQN